MELSISDLEFAKLALSAMLALAGIQAGIIFVVYAIMETSKGGAIRVSKRYRCAIRALVVVFMETITAALIGTLYLFFCKMVFCNGGSLLC